MPCEGKFLDLGQTKAGRQINTVVGFSIIVASTAVIDEDIRGWVMNDNRGRLAGYEKILYAGKNGDLPWLDSDGKIGSFCRENDCDLFTSDKKSYTHYFDDNEIHTIQITKHAFWRDGKKPIFMIRIVNRH
jgi:hypothetical protein